MSRCSLRWLPFGLIVVLIGAVFLAAPGQAKPAEAPDVTPEPFPFSDRYPAEVYLGSPDDLGILIAHNIDIGNVRPADGTRPFSVPSDPFEPLIATVYVNQDEAARLKEAGLWAQPIPNESLRALRKYGPGTAQPSGWPTFDQFVARMQAIVTAHPDIARMISIGKSVQNRDLWMLKISDNPDLEEDEPEFKYTSTMHGNESVGTELTIRLAELLANSYGVDPALTELVDEMEIWLCPIYNPDGYMNNTRYNAHGVDLNRNFPDRITDPYDNPAGREPETQATMYFGYDHRFVMGANYHTGELVVNYPWDSVVNGNPDYAPDDALYYEFSVGYASRNPLIWNGGFPNGVTRGWEWYIIRGGMQDWAYHWQGEHHVTIEVSYSQPPAYNQMDTYWNYNREAMLWWMSRALTGARGLVTDALTGQPLDATVDVAEIGKVVRTDPDVGDYHRLLLPGTYTLVCHAGGYVDQTWTVGVTSDAATVQDCALCPEGTLVAAAGSEISGRPGETVTHTFAITNIGPVTASYSISLTQGEWPATLLDPQLGPLAPQQAGQARVSVAIPADPAGKGVQASDVLTVEVGLAGASCEGAMAQGTTHAVAEVAVALAAGQTARSALAGQAVTYTLLVTNTGSSTDVYTLTVSGNLWPTQATPAQTPPLGPGSAAEIAVRVEIPAGPAGEADTVTIRATSSLDNQVHAEVSLTTLRLWGVYVPVVVKDGG